MAKSKEAFTFEQLNKEMSKMNSFSTTMDKSTTSEISEWIHTGNYHLNACLSGSLFKGIPGNRIMSFAGPAGSGKTFLLLNACRSVQAMGYNIYYYDSENAIDTELATKFGLDPKRIVHVPVNSVEQMTSHFANITDTLKQAKLDGKEIPKIFFALDSMGNLTTRKEKADVISGSEKADMTRAKALKRLFRVITTDLGELGYPFIYTNHTYKDISAFFPTDIPSGGTGPTYNASIILLLSTAQLKEGTSKTGIIVTAKPFKNRFAKPTPIKFHINFNKGMNPYVGLEEYVSWDLCGIEKGKLEKGIFTPQEKGRGFAVKHLDKVVSPKNFFTDAVFTKEVLEKIDEVIKEKFQYSTDAAEDDLDKVILGHED